MPRKSHRAPAVSQSDLLSPSQTAPAPVGDTRESAGETAPLSLTIALPVSSTHRRRGRPPTRPCKNLSEQTPHSHLAPTELVIGHCEDAPTAAALPLAASSSTSAKASTANSASPAAASAELPLSPPPAPLAGPLSSSHTTHAPPVTAATLPVTLQGGQEAVTVPSLASSHPTARTVAAVSESITRDGDDRATVGAQPLLPSLVACMAACFGWLLTRCAFDVHAKITFVLQHRTVPSLWVTIESRGVAFMQAAGITDETNSGAVRVNGILMSLTQCAAYLQELTHRALTLPYASQRAPLADQMLLEGEERGDAVEDGKSISSPIVQVPSPVSPNELAKGAEMRAKKRARSRSPSPHARSITSAPPATELLSGATRLNCSGEPATVGRGNEKRNKVSPSSSPSGFFKSVRTPAPLATAGVQVEAGPSQPLAVPITNQQQHGGDTQSFYDPVALIAATEAGESSSLLPQNPADPRTDTGSVSTASKRDVPLADGGSAPRENALSCTIFASPTMRQRRIVSTLRARAAGGGPTSPVAGAQHAPPASHTSPHVAPRTGTFTMPFAFGHPSAAPFIAGGAQEEVNMVSGKNNSAGVYRGTWCDSGGWSTYSSRFWLAHTHAVSRAFEVMPAPRNGQSATTKDTEPLCNGDADEQRASAAASAFLPVSPTNSETAAAVVRMALRSHWRQRSSIWTAMEDSLRMAVGSGHLRGDALEAGVHALQASEEEHRRYNGMDAEGDERGSNLGASCGMTRSDVGWVTHGAEQRQASSFPACPPRALLPVSGKAVVEAQGRIADTDERGRETDANAPRYIACGGGIPSADRIVIDHTYSTRGSYVMAPHVTAEGTTAPQCHFLTLQRNPQEDLHCHVYKHVMPTDMRVAVEAEDSLTIEPHSVAPVHVANGKFSSAYNPRRDQNGGECDDEGREDSADDSVERKKVCRLSAASRAASRANPAAAHIADVSRGDSSADIDYVLRNHPSIRRIPMPDVELRYGP